MTKNIYDPKKIEQKWVEVWDQKQIYKTENNPSKKKYHVLDMFPYPSGEGLHVGHAKTFGGSDIFARFKRMQGFNVLHSTGWDAYGLPAEQFAIKMKTNPKIQTKKNTDNFEKQMKRIGLSYDWSRTVNTTDPKFYKWTQWIFKQLYKDGMCFESHEPINWCPSCKTGLANEDLEDGKCERCGSVVEKKPIRQWVIKITEYAENLLKGLDMVSWHEHIKDSQRHWIGKSEGAEINFKVLFKSEKYKEAEPGIIPVFTTRPDTIFGATYMVLAPEHTWVKLALEKHSGIFSNEEEVKKYVAEAKDKSEIERGAEGREKTGVKLEGVVAINPATGNEIPIYIADYVLASYGTGAIMAVPSHDERDGEFADKFKIPKVQVVAPYITLVGTDAPKTDENIRKFDCVTCVLKHSSEDKYYFIKFQAGYGLVGGGVEEGESKLDAIKREILEETGFKNLKSIKTIFSHAYSRGHKSRKSQEEEGHDEVFFVELENEDKQDISDEHTKDGVWLTSDEAYKLDSLFTHHKFFFEYAIKNKIFTEAGVLVNSGKFDGEKSEDAKTKIAEFVGGKMVTKYKLRDWVFARQRYWGEPFPIVFNKDHKSFAVSDSELPVVLPDVESYEPTGDGESPLKNISDWVNVFGYINEQNEFVSENSEEGKKLKESGKIAEQFFRETNTMPQWAGSSWYWLRYMDPGNEKELVSKEAEQYWNQVDIYIGGMEHATRHLIYGRFWNQFLYDKGIISTFEPFQRLETVGLVLGKGGVKMSKRLGNVINPDDISEQFGADTLRLYISFSSAFHDSFAWDEKAIVGPRRFIERVWAMQDKISDQTKLSDAEETLLHQTIKKVGNDYEKMSYNTAISQIMILCNTLEKNPTINAHTYKIILQLLAPITPFFTEEIWEALGEKNSIHFSVWPEYDEAKCKAKTVNIVVQIGGKVRDTFQTAADQSEEEVVALAKATEGYKKWVTSEPKKIIAIPNKIVNIVL